jgi:hypothetical protein
LPDFNRQRFIPNLLRQCFRRLLVEPVVDLRFQQGEVEHNDGLCRADDLCMEWWLHSPLPSLRCPADDLEQPLADETGVLPRLCQAFLNLHVVSFDEGLTGDLVSKASNIFAREGTAELFLQRGL